LKITILHEDCDKELSKDASLPYTTYLVEYKLDGTIRYDIVNCKKMIDIFDHYWDHYRHDFIGITQTEGRINPRNWNDPNKKSKKK
jgi:hypothetical protein